MKPWLRLLIAVFALILVVGLLYWPHQPVAAPKAAPLLTFDAANVDQLTIVQPGQPQTQLVRTAGDWKLVQPYAFPADSARVASVLKTLNDITPVQDVGPVTNLAAFGLDQPSTVSIGLSNGQTLSVDFGGDTPTGGSVYVRQGSSGPVAMVPAPIKESAVNTPYELQDKSVIHFPAGQVTAVTISYDGNVHRYEQTNGAWPAPERANLKTLLDVLQTAEMSSLDDRTGNDAASHGLNHPPTSLTLAWNGGSAQLEIGARKSTAEYYARNSDSPAVFTIDSYMMDDITAVVTPAKPAAN